MNGATISLLTLFYPTEGFPTIKKDRNKFTYLTPTLILLMVLYSNIVKLFVMHFPFTVKDIQDINMFQEIFSFIIPFFLWVFGNYYTTSIFSGEVMLREVYAATCYAFLPKAIITIPMALFSNFLSIESSGVLKTVDTIVIIWIAILIFLSIKEMNTFSLPTTIIVILVSVVAAMFIAVIAALIYVLGVKLYDFISVVLKEYKILFFE